MLSRSPRHWNRLPGINLGTGYVSLPDPATAGEIMIWDGPRCAERRGAEAARTFVNPLAAPVCNRFLKSRREDPADAFSVDQMSQRRAHA